MTDGLRAELLAEATRLRDEHAVALQAVDPNWPTRPGKHPHRRDSLSWPQEDGLRWLHLRGGGVSL